MEVLAFLKDRTRFIRDFYETAERPFREIIRKIEEGEAPYDNPPYSEDGEPAYLGEWMDAYTGLEVLGRACVSMLSASLELYFKTWESQLGVRWENDERKRAFEKGFLRGYQYCFGDVLKLSWRDCPADLEILEQIVLARNRDQHPDSITRMGVKHTIHDRKRFPGLFFVSEDERKIYGDPSTTGISWISPSVHVSREALFTAIREVENLAEWLEPKMWAKMY